jgi:hypothetical protein
MSRAASIVRRACAALLLASVAASCASYTSVRFAPPIQDVELRNEGPEARLAIAWREVAAAAGAHELRFRLRFESLAATPFDLASSDFELLDGGLEPFGPPRAEGLPARVEPGASVTFVLAFPPAEGRELGEHDLSAVCLRARFADGRWTSSTSFQREVAAYHDPYWDSPWRFHVGVFWCD